MAFGCLWTAHLYFTNGAYAAEMSSDRTTYATPEFDDLTPKLE